MKKALGIGQFTATRHTHRTGSWESGMLASKIIDITSLENIQRQAVNDFSSDY